MPRIASKSLRLAGRPRSELSRTAILDAAYSFLESAPISSISPLHIARKAGVSTATVYRWWPTKEALLLDAFLYRRERRMSPVPAHSALERVRQYVLRSGRFLMGKDGIVVARLLTAIQDDPFLRQEFLERVYSPNTREIQVAVEDAIREGQLPPTIDVAQFLDMVFGPIISRLLIRHEPIRETFVSSVFDHVVVAVKTIGSEGATRSENEPSGRKLHRSNP